MHPPGPVLHVPYTFAPDPMGGTEVYVEQLARAQRRDGLDVAVVAPTTGPERTYDHGGLRVRRFSCAVELSLEELWGAGDPRAAASFERALDDERPGLVHLHAFTSAVSPRLVRLLQARRIPSVLTYHTPTLSCARGTLMRWGSTPCDGRLELSRCAACLLHGHGLVRPLAVAGVGLSRALGPLVGALGLRGGPFTGLRIHDLVRRRHEAIRELLGSVDRVVALCDWTRRLLRENDVPDRKVRLIRHGLVGAAVTPRPTRPPGPLRVAFLGRLTPEKGADLLVRALAQVERPVELDLYCLAPEGAPGRYGEELLAAARRDPRVRVRAPLPHAEVVPALREYDVVAVPSRGLETGPLVVLEAFAAGVPVLGTGVGGIAERVTDGVDGLLLPPDDAAAWARALTRLVDAPGELEGLRARLRPPPAFDAPPPAASVVRQVADVYRELLGDAWPAEPERQ